MQQYKQLHVKCIINVSAGCKMVSLKIKSYTEKNGVEWWRRNNYNETASNTLT